MFVLTYFYSFETTKIKQNQVIYTKTLNKQKSDIEQKLYQTSYPIEEAMAIYNLSLLAICGNDDPFLTHMDEPGE